MATTEARCKCSVRFRIGLKYTRARSYHVVSPKSVPMLWVPPAIQTTRGRLMKVRSCGKSTGVGMLGHAEQNGLVLSRSMPRSLRQENDLPSRQIRQSHMSETSRYAHRCSERSSSLPRKAHASTGISVPAISISLCPSHAYCLPRCNCLPRRHSRTSRLQKQ